MKYIFFNCLISCLLLFVGFASCRNLDKSNYLSKSVDTINLSDFESIDFWTNISINKIIRLETNENSVVGTIHQMDVYKNYILIHDLFNHNLIVFNKNGNYLYKIGKLGRGPGEFPDIRGYSIDRDNDKVLIMTYKKILTFSLSDGVHLSSQNITLPEDFYNPYKLLKVGQDEFIFWNGNIPNLTVEGKPHYILYKVKDMKVTDKYVIQKDQISLIPQFIRNGDVSYILPQPTSYSVLKVTRNSVLEAFYINFGNHKLPLEISSKPLATNNINEFYKSNYFKGIDSFFNSQDYIYLTCTGPNSYAYEFLYDKASKTSKGRVKLGVSPTLLSIDEDGWFYGVIESSSPLINSKIAQSNEYLIIKDALKDILDSIKIENNPIIIQFKPKK